jgi:hypothetical protein
MQNVFDVEAEMFISVLFTKKKKRKNTREQHRGQAEVNVYLLIWVKVSLLRESFFCCLKTFPTTTSARGLKVLQRRVETKT